MAEEIETLEIESEDSDTTNGNGNGNHPSMEIIKRKRSGKEIKNKKEKIERILFYLDQDYAEADIRDLIGPFLDKKTIASLMSEALEIFHRPKPTEERLVLLEKKYDDVQNKMDELWDDYKGNFAEVMNTLKEMQNIITRRKARE